MNVQGIRKRLPVLDSTWSSIMNITTDEGEWPEGRPESDRSLVVAKLWDLGSEAFNAALKVASHERTVHIDSAAQAQRDRKVAEEKAAYWKQEAERRQQMLERLQGQMADVRRALGTTGGTTCQTK